ncbi:MAG: hypothetical protein FWF82_01045 [Oscillospiraceae bacterium]|nr:hypothetical protein [Oscillospiraceae bacterium]
MSLIALFLSVFPVPLAMYGGFLLAPLFMVAALVLGIISFIRGSKGGRIMSLIAIVLSVLPLLVIFIVFFGAITGIIPSM